MLNGMARFSPPGSGRAGSIVCEKTRRTASRDLARSGTTIPMRALGFASRRSRDQLAATRSSSIAEMNRTRRTFEIRGSGPQAKISTPAAASAARKSPCCGLSISKP